MSMLASMTVGATAEHRENGGTTLMRGAISDTPIADLRAFRPGDIVVLTKRKLCES